MNLECFKYTIDFLNNLSVRECLTYGNCTWKLVTNWLKQVDQFHKTPQTNLIKIYLTNEINEITATTNLNNFEELFSAQNAKLTKMAKLLLMLYDVDDNSMQCHKSTTEILIDQISTCNKYVYASMKKLEKFIFIFHYMMLHFNSDQF